MRIAEAFLLRHRGQEHAAIVSQSQQRVLFLHRRQAERNLRFDRMPPGSRRIGGYTIGTKTPVV